MQPPEESKEEVIRFLEWIEEDPTQWEEILGERSVDPVTPAKTMEDCDVLTFSGLYSVMMMILFSETDIIAIRALKRLAAKSLIQKIEDIGALETSKEILELLKEEWERNDREVTLHMNEQASY